MIHRCTYILTYHAIISTLPRSYQRYICHVSCICIYIHISYIIYIYIYVYIYIICIYIYITYILHMYQLHALLGKYFTTCEIFHPPISSEIQHFRIFNISNIKCYLINIVTHGHSVNAPCVGVHRSSIQKGVGNHCFLLVIWRSQDFLVKMGVGWAGVIHIGVYKRFIQKEWVKHCL